MTWTLFCQRPNIMSFCTNILLVQTVDLTVNILGTNRINNRYVPLVHTPYYLSSPLEGKPLMWETLHLKNGLIHPCGKPYTYLTLYLVHQDKGTQCNLIYENPFRENLGESYSSAISYSTFETK